MKWQKIYDILNIANVYKFVNNVQICVAMYVYISHNLLYIIQAFASLNLQYTQVAVASLN